MWSASEVARRDDHPVDVLLGEDQAERVEVAEHGSPFAPGGSGSSGARPTTVALSPVAACSLAADPGAGLVHRRAPGSAPRG